MHGAGQSGGRGKGTSGPQIRSPASETRPLLTLRSGKPEPDQWLLIQWPDDEKQPTMFWFSNLRKTRRQSASCIGLRAVGGLNKTISK